MKNSIRATFILFVLFVVVSSFSQFEKLTTTKRTLENNISNIKSIVKDTIVVDTIDFNIVMLQENAHASYYHDKFTGKKTASGAIFDNNKLTCAHKTLKFGTKLKVTSKVTGKSVKVIVNDRGPFVKGRDIDLSKKAFMKIAPKTYGGHIKVDIEIIKEE